MPSPQSAGSLRCRLQAEKLEDRLTPAVTVRFDYTFDTTGFFNSADRRAALESAAAEVTAGMSDSLSAIRAGGVNGWSANVYDGAAKQTHSVNNPVIAANEIVVYVSAGVLDGGALGLTSGGAYSVSGTSDWIQTVQNRGQSGTTSGTDYSTWGGMIAFSSNTNWNFSAAAPSSKQYDFHSVALHELMHVFGIGLENGSFTRYVNGGKFTGPETTAVYGSAVPMETGSDPDHFAQSVKYAGQNAVMNPALAPGMQKRMTALEYATLRDVGWGGSTPPAANPPVTISPPVAIVPPATGTANILPPNTSTASFTVGSGEGAPSAVSGLTSNGTEVYKSSGLISSSTSGVRVATGDVNGDGVADYILGNGPKSTPEVKVIDGKTGATIHSLMAFEWFFDGGVYVAAGDVTGDGKADIAVGAGAGGGPRIKVYNGATGTQIADFWGIEDISFRGGVRPALGDIDGDGKADLVAAAGEGGGPRVAAYNGTGIRNGVAPPRLFGDFYAFESILSNGSYVSVADINGDGYGEIIAGAGKGGAPRVIAFNGKSLMKGVYTDWLANFFAGDPYTGAGVRVGAADVNGDGVDDIITAPGPMSDGVVRAYPISAFATGGAPVPFVTQYRSGWDTYGAYVG